MSIFLMSPGFVYCETANVPQLQPFFSHKSRNYKWFCSFQCALATIVSFHYIVVHFFFQCYILFLFARNCTCITTVCVERCYIKYAYKMLTKSLNCWSFAAHHCRSLCLCHCHRHRRLFLIICQLLTVVRRLPALSLRHYCVL